MSIRDVAYDLCRKVGTSTARKTIANLILGFNNQDIGRVGHNQFAQILGYLFAEQNRTQFAEMPRSFQISALAEEERRILASAHAQITDLNRQCVSPLIQTLPDCARVIDPYNKFAYVPEEGSHPVEFLAPADISKMAESFHQHPQIATAIESIRFRSPDMSAEYLIQQIWGIEEELQKTPVEKAPDWFENIRHYRHPDDPQRGILRHIAALLSIRASLNTLNEMIYQKIFSDSLIRIDDDCIIKMVSISSYGGVRLIIRHAGILFTMERHDIVYVKFEIHREDFKELCRVELLDPFLPPDFGEPWYIELRVLGDNLNPFEALLRGI